MWQLATKMKNTCNFQLSVKVGKLVQRIEIYFQMSVKVWKVFEQGKEQPTLTRPRLLRSVRPTDPTSTA